MNYYVYFNLKYVNSDNLYMNKYSFYNVCTMYILPFVFIFTFFVIIAFYCIKSNKTVCEILHKIRKKLYIQTDVQYSML